MNTPSLPSVSRRELLFLGLLILVVLATRLPFFMHGLDEWDSANFALSVLHFDVMHHQPHPPGQYVYVRLLQFINLFTGNALVTLSLASAVCSSLALVPYYFALRQIFRPAVAFGAVVLTAFTFGYWITGLRMISDPVASLFVYGVVCSLLLGLRDRRWFWFGMALCGVTLGVKQTAVYFLAPFTAAVNLVVLFRAGWRRPLLGSALFAVAVAAWLLPTVSNSHGWANYLAACRSMQQENYTQESIIFHLSRGAAQVQEQQNFIQPWGGPILADLMLVLAVVGFFLCLRHGLRGALFALFSLTVAFYAYFFLYRFNKYYVYYLPFYCAFAAATLFAAGDWLARTAHRPGLRNLLPGVGIGLLTVANVAVTAPFLPAVSHFRAPPQNALEHLLRLPGVGRTPLLLTDDVTTGRELLYFARNHEVDLLNLHSDLQDAAAALNAGRKVYFLSPLAFGTDADHPGAIRQIGQYVWRPDLYEPLQGRPDLRELSLYEIAAPLPVEYTFPETGTRPPLLEEGMWEDGWCGADSRFLLPCDASGPDLAHLRLKAPGNLGFRYPFQLVCRFPDGSHQELTVTQPGVTDFVVTLPAHPGARVVQAELLAPQTAQPAQRDPGLNDYRGLSVLLSEIDCVTPDHPLRIHLEDGWYDQESDADHHWRWTNGNATLSVLLRHADTLLLEGTILSFADGNTAGVLVDGQTVVTQPLPGTEWAPLQWRLPLTAGYHQITLHSQKPGVQPPGDGRTLALRLRDLQIRLAP